MEEADRNGNYQSPLIESSFSHDAHASARSSRTAKGKCQPAGIAAIMALLEAENNVK